MHTGADELVPVKGKDEVYDAVEAEISELEENLEAELKTLEKQVKAVAGDLKSTYFLAAFKHLLTFIRSKLSYWHSAQGNKVGNSGGYLQSSTLTLFPSVRQEIYLVETKPTQKVPKNWTKSASTKVLITFLFLHYV